MTSTQFYCRITVFDRTIQDLAVFVWELEPLDRRTRSAREWIEEHIREDPYALFTDLDIQGTGGWEAVFVATIHGHTCGPPDQEYYDENIVLARWQVQQLPSEMFETAEDTNLLAQPWVKALLVKRFEDNLARISMGGRTHPVTRAQYLAAKTFFGELQDEVMLFGYTLIPRRNLNEPTTLPV